MLSRGDFLLFHCGDMGTTFYDIIDYCSPRVIRAEDNLYIYKWFHMICVDSRALAGGVKMGTKQGYDILMM
jgi:hypothetical protein